MQSTIRTYTNQPPNSIPQDLSQEFINDPIACLTYKSSSMNICGKLLGRLAWFFLKHPNIYPSKQTLAEALECSSKSINRHMKPLLAHGIIYIRKRRWNNSSVLGFNPRVLQPEMMKKLAPLVPFFKQMLAIILLSPFGYMGQLFSKKMPVYSVKSFYTLSEYLSNTNMTSTLVSARFEDRPPGGDYISEPPLFWPNIIKTMGKKIELRETDMNLPHVSRLTDDAKVHLMAYPQEIIEEALVLMNKLSNIQSKIKWLQARCTNVCKERGIVPSWGIARQMKEQANPKEDCAIYKLSVQVSADSAPRIVKPLPVPKHLQNKEKNRGPVTEEEIRILKAAGMWDFLEDMRNKILERERTNG